MFSLFFDIILVQQIQIAMLEQARSRIAEKKLNKSTINSFKSSNSITNNPQIQLLLDKIQALTDQFPQEKANPLNLVRWEKMRYKPTESQNRIRIENQISLKKATNERTRPKIKPIKKAAHSVDITFKEIPTVSYKQHYNEILSNNQKKQKKYDEFQSQQDMLQLKEATNNGYQGLKYYHNLKKYKNIMSYIQEKIQNKQAITKTKQSFHSHKAFNSTSNWKGRSSAQLRNTSKTVTIGDVHSDLRVETIIKKWKPASKIEKRVTLPQTKIAPRKRLSLKQHTSGISKLNSPRYESEQNLETSIIKKNQLTEQNIFD